jgi:hypothetical protein
MAKPKPQRPPGVSTTSRTFDADSTDFVCSFCHRKRSDGNRRMIAGPDGVFICDDCIELCAEILEEERRR